VPVASTDPWTAFLDWLSTILLPDWVGLINLLPVLVLLGLTGPILSLLALYWLYHLVTDRRGKVRTAEPEPTPAPIGDDGLPAYPPNVPFCPQHRLLFPTCATVRSTTVSCSCAARSTATPASPASSCAASVELATS
jgi:hypothetical protein